MIDDFTKLNINKCPFCKTDMAYIVVVFSRGLETTMVECGGCTAHGPESHSYEIHANPDDEIFIAARKEAITLWNTANT